MPLVLVRRPAGNQAASPNGKTHRHAPHVSFILSRKHVQHQHADIIGGAASITIMNQPKAHTGEGAARWAAFVPDTYVVCISGFEALSLTAHGRSDGAESVDFRKVFA